MMIGLDTCIDPYETVNSPFRKLPSQQTRQKKKG